MDVADREQMKGGLHSRIWNRVREEVAIGLDVDVRFFRDFLRSKSKFEGRVRSLPSVASSSLLDLQLNGQLPGKTRKNHELIDSA